jgi:hypothetical protein
MVRVAALAATAEAVVEAMLFAAVHESAGT